jgi:hypothetical protein
MMFLVGYISRPPTTGLFIPAKAEVTANATIASPKANLFFTVLNLSKVEFAVLVRVRTGDEIGLIEIVEIGR